MEMVKKIARSRKSAPAKRKKPEALRFWVWFPGVERRHTTLHAYWGTQRPMNVDYVPVTLNPRKGRK
jgi:hypothetical protein